jgi:hypothetical protein
MIDAYHYAVRLDGTGPLPDSEVLWLGGESPRQVAPSFREFMERYLANPASIAEFR